MKKEDKKPTYILCPRCELNYIKSKDKYCTVCKAELGLVDPSILLPDEDVDGEKLCPICNINYIGEDEEICFLCQKEREEREVAEKKDEWSELDNDPDDITPIGILPLEEDSLLVSDDEQEEEEEESEHEDDFEYPDADDLTDDYDDEEDEDDDDIESDFED